MRLVTRADGGPDIGYGHLVRTGALAREFLAAGHDVTYCTRSPDAVRDACPDGVDVVSFPPETVWSDFVAWLETTDPDLVLTDSYEADDERQRAIAAATTGRSGVVVDDTRFRIHADFVVNGNVYAPSLDYEWSGTEPDWYLGPDYLAIRREICALTDEVPPFRDPPESALLTMGGSDINDVTPEAMRAFLGTDLDLTVVVGPGFSNQDRIERTARDVPLDVTLREHPDDLPELMARADLAVTASGSTTYELLALGTPMIAIPQADNQVPVATALADRGVAEHLPFDRFDDLHDHLVDLAADTDRRRQYSQRGRSLVDCRGAERLYEEIAGGVR